MLSAEQRGREDFSTSSDALANSRRRSRTVVSGTGLGSIQVLGLHLVLVRDVDPRHDTIGLRHTWVLGLPGADPITQRNTLRLGEHVLEHVVHQATDIGRSWLLLAQRGHCFLAGR